jgi:hypothetical protein
MVIVAKGFVIPEYYDKKELAKMVKETEYLCPCCGSAILKFGLDEDSEGNYWIDEFKCCDCGVKFGGSEVHSITTYYDGHTDIQKGECIKRGDD